MKFLGIILILLFAVFQNAAQEHQEGKDNSIPKLIEGLENEREFETKNATNALVKIGTEVVNPLVKSLERNKDCQFQFNTAEVIRQLDPKREIVKTTLYDVASGKCEYRYPPEKYLPDANFGSIISQWFAATILAVEVEGGITMVTQLLKEEKGIYSAAFAFAHLVEKIEKNDLERIELKPAMIGEIKTAIPLLVKTLDVENKKLRCDFYDIIQSLQKSSYQELKVEANRAMQGKTVNCS